MTHKGSEISETTRREIEESREELENLANSDLPADWIAEIILELIDED